MERYRLEGKMEVVIATCVELEPGEMEQLEASWGKKQRHLEALLRDKVHISSYGGNGGTDKLIGVVGRDNTITCDVKYKPVLTNVRRIP